MFAEKRITPRIKTHIVIEMIVKGETKQYYGYVENLSAGGMGVVSLDSIEPGTKVSTVFFLPETRDKICPIAAVVHNSSSIDPRYGDRLNYHGFTFESLREQDHAAINEYVDRELEAASSFYSTV